MVLDAAKVLSSAQLPSLPTVAVRLIELSNSPDSTIDEICATVKSDPAIAARILKVANSSYIGLSREVSSLDRAVPILGTGVIASLTLSFSLAEESLSTGPAADSFRRYWLQSVVQASAAEVLAKHVKGVPGNELFLCGLLCDVGRLAILRVAPDEYVDVIRQADASHRSWLDVERELLGFDHVEIGHQLIQQWNLPARVVESVAHHHRSCEAILQLERPLPIDEIKVSALASTVADYFCRGQNDVDLAQLQLVASQLFGFGDEQLGIYLGDVRTLVDSTAEILDVQVGQLPDASEIMALANARLIDITLQAQQAVLQTQAEKRALVEANQNLEDRNLQLQDQAVIDHLTQVYNRSFFDEFLDKEVSRAERSASSVGVIFSDIDHFKQLNDTYGHQFGDYVLQIVAQSLRSAIRENDVLARYGGEEFVAVLVDTSVAAMEEVAERMRTSVERTEVLCDKTKQRVPVTISVGACGATPSSNSPEFKQRLVETADAAMYEAKRNGRNQTRVDSMSSTSPMTA